MLAGRHLGFSHCHVIKHQPERARVSLRWPNTVFARAFADAIQRAHKDCKNKHAVDTAIILLLNARSIFAIFLVIERRALMALIFYNKGMLEKVTMQRTQQFSDFSKSKEPSYCSACAVAQKIETDCFCTNFRFLTIQSLEFQEIWQKKNSSSTT